MRPFEYGLNKPAREAVYTTLNSKENINLQFSSIHSLIDLAMLQEVYFLICCFLLGLVAYIAPLAIIPLAIYLMYLGLGISKSVSVVKSK